MYRRESRVLYELIFVAFDWFRILMHDHRSSRHKNVFFYYLSVLTALIDYFCFCLLAALILFIVTYTFMLHITRLALLELFLVTNAQNLVLYQLCYCNLIIFGTGKKMLLLNVVCNFPACVRGVFHLRYQTQETK